MIEHCAQSPLSHNASFPFFDLSRLFEKIIQSWQAKPVEKLGGIFNDSLDLPKVKFVRLTGSLEGILMLRCSNDFPSWLRNHKGPMPWNYYNDEEILNELISLLCLKLFHSFWKPDGFRVGPIQPYETIPVNRPSQAPTAACGLKVENYPVEIRLWLTDSAEHQK